MEGELRDFCRGLIAALDGADTADAAAQYSQHIPVHGICQLLGVPEEDADMFRDWIFRNFQLGPIDLVVSNAGIFFRGGVEVPNERRAASRRGAL